MANIDNAVNAMTFKEESNYKNKITVFHDRLKRHLSSEYLSISDRKDALESEVVEMKFELEQKDKKLFKTSNQKDTRQYFSPLNLSGYEENQKDERMKQLSSDVARLENEISQLEGRLSEIRDLLREVDIIEEFMKE